MVSIGTPGYYLVDPMIEFYMTVTWSAAAASAPVEIVLEALYASGD
jgi:hypothetical protein